MTVFDVAIGALWASGWYIAAATYATGTLVADLVATGLWVAAGGLLLSGLRQIHR